MTQPTLNRRSSISGEGDVTDILIHLRARDRLACLKIGVLLAVGIPSLFIGPLVLSSVFWMAAALLFHVMAWFWFFLTLCLIMVPLLFWTEWRTRGHFLDEAMEDIEVPNQAIGVAMVHGFGVVGALGVLAANPRATAAGAVEIFLFGPRQVLDAVQELRWCRRFTKVDRQRAADILVKLRSVSQGISPEVLLRPDEAATRLTPQLTYLLVRNWIGIAANGNRVWLLSEARAIFKR